MTGTTIYTLAKELGMTPSMISRALNPNGRISEEKRKIVLDAAKRHNFAPNKFASRLSMPTVHIGVVINSRFDVNLEKMTESLKSAHERLKDYKIHYDVTVCHSFGGNTDELAAALNSYRGYDGIIVAGMSAPEFTELINAAYERNENIVQVQAINSQAKHLFASKHDEKCASNLAAEFLASTLRHSQRKNVLLFTGDLNSALHHRAKEAFISACEGRGLSVIAHIDMHDSAQVLEEILPEVFKRYGASTDGIYITSGISEPLCRYIEKEGYSPSLVTFDVHEAIRRYLDKGVISASISQDIAHQMSVAFDLLVSHIITGEVCPVTVFTDVQLVLKSNMHQFN